MNGDGYSDVIVGAPAYNDGQAMEGRAYVYYGSTSGLATVAGCIKTSNHLGDHFGYSVASAGDVNGDGYSDVIVGAPDYDNGNPFEGRALVYHGSSSGLSSSASWTAESNVVDSYFGYSVASAGDVDGNGYSDVIIGAPHYANGNVAEGAAYVYLGSSTGLASNVAWSAESNQDYANFGCSVASAGDVDGNGYSDIIIGANYYDNVEANEGKVFLWCGSATGLGNNGTPTNADWTAESNVTNYMFGNCVASAGDVNGDGYSDIIVGDDHYGNGSNNYGRVFVWYGSSSGLGNNGTPANADWYATCSQQSACMGSSVSSAGDVNGDGCSDIIVGVPYYDNSTNVNSGKVFAWYGALSTGLGTSNRNADWTAIPSSPAYLDFFGWCVASAGDVNGDGCSEVIVGAPGIDGGNTNEGRAYVYHGHLTAGLSETADWSRESDQTNANYGYSVASAGDVNGDGYCDVIIGAPDEQAGEETYSKTYLYYGNGGAGDTVLPRQFRPNLSTPVVPSLSTYSSSQAGLSLLGQTFYGRSNVKAQFEVKARGTAFNGSSLNETSWTNVCTGTKMNLVKNDLSQNTLYKWRARIKYSPCLSVQPYGPWYYLSANAPTECDFRTVTVFQQEDMPHYRRVEESTTSTIMMPLKPYPNPFKTFTVISGYEDKKVLVYDLTGRQVGVYSGSRVGEDLLNGIYFVRPLEGNAQTVKLLKVR